MKLKVYIGNLDGQRHGLVIAGSKKQAAQAAVCSLYAFNQYWWEHPTPPDTSAFEVGVLYSKPIDYSNKHNYAKGRCVLPERN